MPRNSFVQLNKLTNVSGRITYISSKAKQENLYATYTTVSERSFWRELAKCNQESFRQSGSEGKCIEARELIIALPESFVYYEPEYLLRRFTDHFKQNYKVECISALHHNKRKTNYHIHLIFAERQLLDKPIEKIATRNMFYDEKGKHRRTKKEILDETWNIRKKCKVIRKGEVYERHLFTTKNELFKADGFLDEVKRIYTDLINVCAIKEEDKLQVFDRNGMYLATKKIGKNNPKAAEIEADNMERVRWNQAVDRALISGVSEEDILDVKREKISKEVKRSIELYGNNPSFLVGIIRLAIQALELLVSKVLLAAVKVAEKIVDVVHEKVVEKEVLVLVEEPEQAVEIREKVQLPKKPEEPLLLSKYPVIMELDISVKEFQQMSLDIIYPINVSVERNEDGWLTCSVAEKSKFNKGKERFNSSIKRQVELRNVGEATNQIFYVLDCFEANGTSYIVVPQYSGSTYSENTEIDLYNRIKICKSVAEYIKNCHTEGYLCLDIKPDNIFVIPETSELAMFFDFDSVCRMDEVMYGENLSYTSSWAAPEQIVPGSYAKISKASDIFVLGELLYWSIFDCHSSPRDYRSHSCFDYSKSKFESELTDDAEDILSDIFHHTLRSSVNNRYASVVEFIDRINDLLKEIYPDKESLINVLPVTTTCFIGREYEIEQINKKLEEDKLVILTGVGGIGKSEIAKKYVNSYKSKYKTIIYLTYTFDLVSTINRACYV